MDCCLCSSGSFRPPRNTICSSCFDGAKGLLHLASRMQQGGSEDTGLKHAFKEMENLQLAKDRVSERLAFLSYLGDTFDAGEHTDLEMVSNDGHSLHAHRIVLSSKSSVFKAMFEVDRCKVGHAGPLVIYELDREQLHSLLEFVYRARLSEDALARNAAPLLVAADKYDIPLLRNVCELRLANTVCTSNVLEMLELATLCSAEVLKENAMKVVLRGDYEDLVFSKEYEDFAIRNAQIAVELTKGLVRALKKSL